MEQTKRTKDMERQIAEQIVPEEKKPSKYRNIKVYVYENGVVSKGEQLPKYGKPEWCLIL